MNTYTIDRPIILAGDIHGQPRFLCSKLAEYDIKDSAIVLLGDIGLGFYDNHGGCCKFLNKEGQAHNNIFYLLRGNHDNPSSYNDTNKRIIEEKYPNVKVLQDFDVVVTKDGRRGIVVAGGISIDRQYRVVGKSYWRNELIDYSFVPEEQYDFVLAHSGPTPPSCDPSNPFFAKMVASDTGLVKILEEEQEYITKFIEKTKPAHWYNGHYHWRNSESFEFLGTIVHVFGEASDETDAMGRSYMAELR